MINFVGKFLPNLSARTGSLHTLFINAVEWNWARQHQSEWQYIEDILSSQPILKFFDHIKKITFSTRMSRTALEIGDVLLQEHNGNCVPGAYTARSMTIAEQRCAQI